MLATFKCTPTIFSYIPYTLLIRFSNKKKLIIWCIDVQRGLVFETVNLNQSDYLPIPSHRNLNELVA